jgi:23S rRNA (uracil1939-C5)-methyltransferase
VSTSPLDPVTTPDPVPADELDRDLDLGPVLDLDVERVVAGGEGLARRIDEPVVFVRGALPGERVRARLVDQRKGWARAELVEVLTASPDRIDPPCAWVAAGCGGCDLQHVDPAAQPALKAATVVDGLRRLGHLEDPVVTTGPSLAPEGFRTTVRAAVRAGEAGFRRHHSHDVVVPGSCLVAHPMVEHLLVDGFFGAAREVTIRVGAATGEALVLASPTAEGVVLPEGSETVAVVGRDQLSGGHRAWIHEEVSGRLWRISAQSFFQTRPDGAAALVEAVLGAAGSELAGARVVDAYSGVGLLAGSLFGPPDDPRPDAPASLVAVERSTSAVADARVNLADLMGQGGPVRVVRSDMDGWRASRADLVVADPARAGLGRRAVEVIAKTGAAVVVLVSCDAASLGRDAALLAGAGYRFEAAQVIDLFPQSHHVEVVSRFVR